MNLTSSKYSSHFITNMFVMLTFELLCIQFSMYLVIDHSLIFVFFSSFGTFIGCSFDILLLTTPLVSPSLSYKKKQTKTNTNMYVKADAGHVLYIWDIVATGSKIKNNAPSEQSQFQISKSQEELKSIPLTHKYSSAPLPVFVYVLQ